MFSVRIPKSKYNAVRNFLDFNEFRYDIYRDYETHESWGIYYIVEVYEEVELIDIFRDRFGL